MISSGVAEFLDREVVGTLATMSAAGKLHQSPVYFTSESGELLVSTEAGRLKARDVEETGFASLCVMGHERPFPSVTLAGATEIRRDGIGSATARIAQRMLGLDEPPEPQSDEALAGAGRVILAIKVERVGPVSYMEP